MNWEELKRTYIENHLSKNLSAPKIRLNALNKLEVIFKLHFREIIKDPHNLLKHNKDDFKLKVSKYKENGRLNGAEESVINGLYKFLI
jgi:hypothetical protein